jgi:hypothetical protein
VVHDSERTATTHKSVLQNQPSRVPAGGSLSCQAQKKTSRAKKIQSVKASPQQKPQQLKAPVDAVRELLEWYFRCATSTRAKSLPVVTI